MNSRNLKNEESDNIKLQKVDFDMNIIQQMPQESAESFFSLSDHEKREILRFLDYIRKNWGKVVESQGGQINGRIVDILVGGSMATGAGWKFSDIDCVLVADKPLENTVNPDEVLIRGLDYKTLRGIFRWLNYYCPRYFDFKRVLDVSMPYTANSLWNYWYPLSQKLGQDHPAAILGYSVLWKTDGTLRRPQDSLARETFPLVRTPDQAFSG